MENNNNDVGCTIDMGDNLGGIGAQVAFLTTSTITIVAVLLGYFLDALEEKQLKFLDREIISRVQTSYGALKGRLTGSYMNLARRACCREEINELWDVRKEAISRFILAASDTQLVTGLAILFAGICNGRSITMYELHVVLCQAWLASTTHLATLYALRDHLRSYGILRNVRVACMTVLLSLLVVAFAIVLEDWAWCSLVSEQIYHNSSTTSDTTNGTQVERSTASIKDSSSDKFKVGKAAWIAVLMLILGSYFIRIQDLYVNQRHTLYTMSSFMWRYRRAGNRDRRHNQYFAALVSASRLRRVERISDSKGAKRAMLTAIHIYEGSFLSSFPGIFFCYLYGVTWEINLSLVIPDYAHIEIKGNTMNFGQMMSVLLLLLPIFAAAATYYEYHNERDRKLKAFAKRRASIQINSEGSVTMPSPISQPRQSSRTVFDNLLTVEQIYEYKLSEIQQYHSAEVLELRDIEAKLTSEEIFTWKQEILTKNAVVEEFERTIGATPAICLFFIQMLLMVPLAFLLNVGWFGASFRMAVAACIFLVVFGFEILWIAYEIFDFLTIGDGTTPQT